MRKINSTILYITSIIMSACVVAVFISIFIDFTLYNDKHNTKHEKRSFIATGSMTAFYVLYCILIKYNIGRIIRLPEELFRVQLLLGILMIIAGTIVNIIGRMQLKGNWANHIKIYENHSLITRGVYSFVRHPLYASIILMLYGGAVIYSNWLNVIVVSFIFIPAISYRAKQEELLLSNEFPEYAAYKKQVGLFFPKQLRGYKSERI